METMWSILKESWYSLSDTLVSAGPRIVAAIVILVVGLLVARTAKALLHHALRAVRFETLSERLGVSNALQRADVQMSSSEILCTLVYWSFLLFTALFALATLEIANASTFAAVGEMIPNVVIAVAILMLGLNVSAFLAKLIQTAAVNAELRQARFVRNAAYYGMATLVAVLSLKQLGIPNDLLTTAFTIFFGATCLGLALAFGLGSRDLAGDLVHATWKSEQEQSRTLAEASELGNDILPSRTKMRPRTRRNTRTASA